MHSKIYDRVEIIGFIEEEMLIKEPVPYSLVSAAKNLAYEDDTAYNLMVEYMKTLRPGVLKRLEVYLRMVNE